ncbi:glutamate--tRNA ligase [Propionimicrobium lymphophilum]|uniref:glutamate--tRNA ligase n=1 Tax=Propionimicrobium lymphophilum TaxID=33012 RepID=UPI0023F04E64|nr:glutamate--tRNA ligase [Propionimicrobium lymphophilum]
MIEARTRVAPSPTGDPHVGTAYMALFDKAWAEKTGGKFVLRIEDTDQNRLVEGSEQQIYDMLDWLGLDPDESPILGGPYEPYKQSERLDTYKPYVEKLIENGHAYYCWCSAERLADMRAEQAKSKQENTGYDRMCLGMTREERAKLPGFSETPVVRMLIPDDAPTMFDDLIRGRVKAPFPDDQVILKADGFPTYHMAVVVDDHLMNISTVVRGEEWISSTPKHMLLYKWLGWDVPQFAHMPLLRNTDHSKISKRKNPAARLTWFREQGYLPEALRNFLQLLAYPPTDDNEVESFESFVENFDWAKVNTVGPVFDTKKLDWLNGVYIRSLSDDELADRIIEHAKSNGKWEPMHEGHEDVVRAASPIIKERLVTLDEALEKIRFLFITNEELTFDETAVSKLKENAGEVVESAISVLDTIDDWTTENIEAALREDLVGKLGIKPRFAFNPVRLGTSGQQVSPPLFESLDILGKDESLARLKKFAAFLSER